MLLHLQYESMFTSLATWSTFFFFAIIFFQMTAANITLELYMLREKTEATLEKVSNCQINEVITGSSQSQWLQKEWFVAYEAL